VEQLDVLSLALPPGVEALVVHDRDDDVIPVAEARLLEAAWPGARFLYTDGLGHRDILADAAVVDTVARFIVDGPDPVRATPWAER
jgi:pimeloyl-ACP methyl ester carboxylesterase